MALTGTLLGVLLNASTPGWGIVIMLTMVLGSMTSMTLSKGLDQREQELSGIDGPASSGGGNSDAQENTNLLHAFFGRNEEEEKAEQAKQEQRKVTSYFMLGALLVICITCGVLRHHMGFCLDALKSGVKADADEACK